MCIRDRVNWVAQHQPDIASRTHKVLLLSGFLTQRLCGRFVDSTSSCVAYLPFDYKRLRWAAPGDWKWQALKVRPEQLPELFKPGERLGSITAAASHHTGIPEGLPLIAAGADLSLIHILYAELAHIRSLQQAVQPLSRYGT